MNNDLTCGSCGWLTDRDNYQFVGGTTRRRFHPACFARNLEAIYLSAGLSSGGKPIGKRLVTQDDLAALRAMYQPDAVCSPLNADLSGVSAEAAVRHLWHRWADVQPGTDDPKFFSNASILGDLDETIEQLREYRLAAEKVLTQAAVGINSQP